MGILFLPFVHLLPWALLLSMLITKKLAEGKKKESIHNFFGLIIGAVYVFLAGERKNWKGRLAVPDAGTTSLYERC